MLRQAAADEPGRAHAQISQDDGIHRIITVRSTLSCRNAPVSAAVGNVR